MANYTAADIKALRERTGAGMLDVKKALDEADGDSEKALELIRIKGLRGVSKREGRATSEGLVALAVNPTADGETGVLIEVNSETDFVAKSPKFIELADQLLAAAIDAGATDVDGVLTAKAGDETAQELLDNTAATLGEKIVLRRVAVVSAPKVTSYLHRTSRDLPPSIGVLVGTDAAGVEAGKDVAQHIAAMAPTYLNREEIPAEKVESERRIADETSRNEGKPEAALPKIIEGRLNGFFKEVVLLEQPLARDPKKTVAKAVAEVGGNVTEFVRFRVGA